MPIRHHDPYQNRAARLDATVNPFVAKFTAAVADGSLPIAHGPELAAMRGAWRDKIAAFHGRATPYDKLVVEIGCHKGLTINEMAAEHPDTAFIGIDITFKRVVTTAERARDAQNKNVFTILANAAGLDRLFAPGEVDGFVIFFPDPWVKKQRQAKNRLVNDAFADKAKEALAPSGFLWFKSDQAPYFEETRRLIEARGFTPEPDLPGKVFHRDYLSTFEKRFALQELPTHGGAWRLCYN